MRAEEQKSQASFRLRAGEVRRLGLMGLWESRKDVGLVARMAWLLALVALIAMLPDMLGWQGSMAWAGVPPLWCWAAALCCGASTAAAWPGWRKPAVLRPMCQLQPQYRMQP